MLFEQKRDFVNVLLIDRKASARESQSNQPSLSNSCSQILKKEKETNVTDTPEGKDSAPNNDAKRRKNSSSKKKF